MYGILVNPRRSFDQQDYNYQGHPVDNDDEPLLIDADFDEILESDWYDARTDDTFMTFNLPVADE